MKFLDCSTLCMPLIARMVDYIPTPLSQCIACLDDGKPIAGVIYDSYNEKSISAHIWIKDGCTPSREWYGAIFDYAFDRLGVHKILGQVYSGNEQARKLDEHFGFVLEGMIKDYSPKGDLLLYTMTREQCRVLNNPLWNRIMTRVRAA